MDNRIADANKKTQSAPQPEEVENLIWTFRCDLRRATPGDVSEMLLTLVNADDLHKAINLISDLTRRLAEAEAELAARTRLASNAQDALRHARAEILSRFTHMEFADRQADANIWVYDLEALCSGLEYQLIRAAAAEARVRELEATIDAMAEAHAHDDMALTAAYLSGAHEGKKQAEAERDALREALTEIVCISDYEMYDECAHSIPLEDCHKLAQAALAATEVKP